MFLKPDGGGWRAPRVNESCCARPQLARLLEDVAATGPEALYSSSKAQVVLTAAAAILQFVRGVGCTGRFRFRQDLSREIQGEGGILTASDLVSATPSVKDAVQAEVSSVSSKPVDCCVQPDEVL